MDYSLENLGPERFQQICHALLARAFPSTQCFPVGQPDGGRDAVSYSVPHPSRELVVYQVKFVRRPLAEKDCRDFALWLNRSDPFAADESAGPPEDWQGSLESFLARQIVHHSGGASFTLADLHAVVRPSAVLLVFDGLDEVADLGRRRRVVEEILKGIGRLKDNSASIQTIVTSRPAAFSDSPGLRNRTWVWLFFVGHPEGFGERHGKSYLTRRRRGEEGGGGGSVTGGTVPSV